MTSVGGMVVGHQTMQDTMHHFSSARSIADEGALVFYNLPSRPSNSDWEPYRMSYYNEDEHQSVPFKWELAPGKPVVDESLQAQSPHQSSLKLQLPPSASSSPLHPLQRPSLKDNLLSKLRNYNPSESGVSMSRSRSTDSALTVDSRSSNGGFHRVPFFLKGSVRTRVRSLSEFEGQPEVLDDDLSSTARTTDVQELPSKTTQTAKLSSSSLNSSYSSQPLSPVDSPRGRGLSLRGGRSLFLQKNSVRSAAPLATSPANCYLSGAGISSTEGSEDVGDEREDYDDHVRPTGGLLKCMPIFSKGDKKRLTEPTINCSTPPRPGIKNRSYRQSPEHMGLAGVATNQHSSNGPSAGTGLDAPKVNPFRNIAKPPAYVQRNRGNTDVVYACSSTGSNYDAISCP